MTQQEYDSLLAQARATYASMTVDTYKKIRDTYISASESVAAAVKAAERAGASEITYQGLLEIEAQLKIAADKITTAINNGTLDLMNAGVSVGSEINIDYLDDALDGITGLPFTAKGIKTAYLSVNEFVVQSTINRLFQDGYSFSERVWKIGEKYQEEMKDIIAQGLAMGRSSIDIAKDIQAYVKDGRIGLANRYGPGLERGTKEFLKRIGNRVDWRALRLARSELYMSLQDAAKEQGRLNPASTGMYEWINEANRQHWDCVCPDYSKNSPYTYEQVPGYPHSNCRCRIQAILRDQRKFQEDMQRWANGEQVDYIDEWYNTVYKTYA